MKIARLLVTTVRYIAALEISFHPNLAGISNLVNGKKLVILYLVLGAIQLHARNRECQDFQHSEYYCDVNNEGSRICLRKSKRRENTCIFFQKINYV